MKCRTNLPFTLASLLIACGGHVPPTEAAGPSQRKATASASSAAAGSAGPPSAPPAAPPPVDAIGTADPVAVDAASPHGSWVVVCQAREDTNGDGVIDVQVGPRGELSGDRMQAYLIIGKGTGRPIDELLAVDPMGRWLAVRQEGRVLLVDTTGGDPLDLTAFGADARSDATPYAQHRSISFDGSGTQLAYVRATGAKSDIVVRSLADGSERVVDPGPGKLWRAALDTTGKWVVIQMITEDTSGNGRLGWPVPEAERLPHRCAGPLPRYAAWQDRGDQPATLVARASGGRAKLMTSLVAPLRDRLLVRLPGGEIYVRPWKGKGVRFGDGTCLGHLVHADVDRELALFACEQEEGRPRIELRGPGYRQELGVEVAGQAVQVWPTSSPRLVAVYPGQDALLVDFETRRTIALQPRDRVLLVDGPRALVRRADNVVLVNVATAEEQPLAALPRPIVDVKRQPPVVVISPFVVDVRQGKVLGQEVQRPLAVTTQGHVLVALGREQDADALAVGPLQWRTPRPVSETRP